MLAAEGYEVKDNEAALVGLAASNAVTVLVAAWVGKADWSMKYDGVLVSNADGEADDVLDAIGEEVIVPAVDCVAAGVVVVDCNGVRELLAATEAVALDVGQAVIDANAVGVDETRTQASWLTLGS